MSSIMYVNDPFLGGTRELRTTDLTSNINQKLRDAAEIWPNPGLWNAELANGDFVRQGGNTAGAGYLEISKSPYNNNSESILTLVPRFKFPLRLIAMVSMSHRNAGEQVASMELVSDDASYGGEPVPDPIPAEILNASQSTTTITINFAEPPPQPFRVGQVVSVYGFVDTRLNVNNATVATTPTPTQITIVGNDYAFTSTTIASTNGNGTAFIERYDQLGRARNGIAVVHGSATATQRRFYARAQGGLARPSGTLAGSHHATTGTDASTALAGTAPFSDSWGAPLETVFMCNREGVIVADRAPDAGGSTSGRFRSSQIVPNPERDYLLRFKVRATPSLTRPLAKIVSITKAGSTTTTIVTDGPHFCETGQYVGFYGVRNQTAFANQTTGLICTVVDENTLTVVHGSSATAVSHGGFLMRVQGQQALGGAVAQVAQSVTRVNNILTIAGNANWAAPIAIGAILEVIGVRVDGTGADLGVDGSYIVRNFATTALTLEPVGNTTGGDDIASTNVGGGVVMRLGYRIHGVTLTDYQPQLVEHAFAGLQDAATAVPILGVVSVSGSAAVSGSVAVDAAIGSPVTAGLRASNANITAMSAAGDNVAWLGTMIGAGVVKPYALPEAEWVFTGLLTATTDVVVQAAAGAGLKRHVTMIQATNTGAADVDVILKDGATTRPQITVRAGQSVVLPLPTGIPVTANTALNVALSAAGTVRVNVFGYTAP